MLAPSPGRSGARGPRIARHAGCGSRSLVALNRLERRTVEPMREVISIAPLTSRATPANAIIRIAYLANAAGAGSFDDGVCAQQQRSGSSSPKARAVLRLTTDRCGGLLDRQRRRQRPVENAIHNGRRRATNSADSVHTT